MLEGDMCEDFLFSTKNKSENSLLNFRGEYLIIYFCNPICHICDAAHQDFADHFKEKNKFKPFNLLYIELDEFRLPSNLSDQISIRGIIPFEEELERVRSIYRIIGVPFILWFFDKKCGIDTFEHEAYRILRRTFRSGRPKNTFN